MSLDITAQRVSSESTILSVLISDDVLHTIDTKYRILAIRKSSLAIVCVKQLDGPFSGNTGEYTYNKIGSIVNIRTLFNLNIYGDTFLIQVERYDLGSNTYTSTTTQAATLPKAPILNTPIDSDMEYDDNGIPKSILLTWVPGWSAVDNPNAIGYSIYYSLTERGTVLWDEWRPITSGGGKVIMPLNKTSYRVQTPYLTDVVPCDVRFMIVTVDNNIKQQESRASNIVKYELLDCITAMVGKDQSILHYEYDNKYTKPVTINIYADRFAQDDVQLMLRRTRYQVPFANYNEIYSYELKATAPLIKPLSIIIHIELIVNTKFEVRIFNNNKWIQIPATNNLTSRTVTFVLHTITNFALLIPDTSLSRYNSLIDSAEKKFTSYTNRMLSRMPVWSKLRRNPVNSLGADFLNVFGLEFDEMKYILDYATDQQYISTLDINRIDWVSKFKPNIELHQDNIIKVFDEHSILQETDNLEDFLTIDDSGSYRPKIIYDNPFIVDYHEQLIYTRKHHAKVKLEVYDNAYNYKLIHEDNYELEWHHIWGFIDEFGMLLDLKRLPYEPNIKFKERILDVFINPSNASKEGLMNGIARELGIRHNVIWPYKNQPLVIKDPMIIINFIKCNETLVSKEYITFNDKGDVVISPLTDDTRYTTDKFNNYVITYVSGLEMHTFYKQEDYIFRHQLYAVDGLATKLFRYYIQRIKHEIPIEWGWFTWNQAYWDIADKEMSGFGHLPTALDSEIKGFREYNKAVSV